MGNPITLQYAENEAVEELDGLEKAAAKKLYGSLGINDIFVGASTLRLEYRQETIGGIAEWEDDSGTRFTAFENKYTQYSILKTEEQGMYKGFTYTQNNLPMSVAFFDSSIELGYIYQRRSVDYMGAGFSLQAGISIDAEYYLNSVNEESRVCTH